MKDYKRGSHTVWDCKYHLVWTTKYRYQVLGGDVGLRCRELLGEIAMSNEQGDGDLRGSINRDHVHMLIGIPPQLSVSRAVQYLKGKSSHRLLSEYKALRNHYWDQHLWARGYWLASSGNVTDEVWKDDIKNQQPPEPDDDFTVV
jgi:putative transposase